MNIQKKLCEICNANESKYKCPQCLMHYCCLSCYKTHKETCDNFIKSEQLKKDEKISEESTSTNEDQIACKVSLVADYDEEAKSDVKNVESDFIPVEKLKLLGQSEELKQILSNKHLKELLKNLNEHTTDIDQKIQKAMQEPLFTEFSDACLKIVQDKKDLHLS